MSEILRRKTKQVRIGNLSIGGDAPIVVEGMLKQDLRKIDATRAELERLVQAGCELVRVALPSRSSVPFFKRLVAESPIPVMADVHFSWSIAREAINAGAPSVRVNPGNMRKTAAMRRFAKEAKDANVVVRVGANSGSVLENDERLSADEMVERLWSRTLDFVKMFEDEGVTTLIVGAKSSNVFETILTNRMIAKSCEYPLHIGMTSTGTGDVAAIKSAGAIAALLVDGIGDTIRVSLTDSSEAEVLFGRKILQSLGLRKFSPELLSCPTCGRCRVDLKEEVKKAEKRLSSLAYGLKIAIMGCVVNGPGEAREADYGVAYGAKRAALFAKGKRLGFVPNYEAIEKLIGIIDGSKR
jgi:(E)-4-hydroxy-3-methylbut-2-enyl-diphosphate synthase